MSSWSFDGKKLFKDGINVRKFESKILQTLPYKDAVIVLVDVTESEGVYFINFDGSIKWRINSREHINHPITMFFNIYFQDDNLIAYEGSSYDCHVDIETGKVTKIDFTK